MYLIAMHLIHVHLVCILDTLVHYVIPRIKFHIGLDDVYTRPEMFVLNLTVDKMWSGLATWIKELVEGSPQSRASLLLPMT